MTVALKKVGHQHPSALCSPKQQIHEAVARLRAPFAEELRQLEWSLEHVTTPAGSVGQGARDMLSLPGKRLRPLCVFLAANAGAGINADARSLALAVEIIHAATLLHDDIVDHAPLRRTSSTAWTLFGARSATFSGDHLLIDGLTRVAAVEVEGVFEDLLQTIDQMILGETLQLQQRGSARPSLEDWQRIAAGKTAALFHWCMAAGGRAGGLPQRECEALGRFGLELGLAFQALDDLLDVRGDEHATGKELLRDLEDGKMSLPLILACQRDPEIEPRLARLFSDGGSANRIHIARALQDPQLVTLCSSRIESHLQNARSAVTPLFEPAKCERLFGLLQLIETIASGPVMFAAVD